MDLYHHPNPSFTRWVVEKELLAERLVVIDIGVQGGEHPRWQFLGPYVEVHGFDPIVEVIDELKAQGEVPGRHYYNLALGNEDGERRFYVSSVRPGSSFYAGADTADERIVPIRRLDGLFAEGLVPKADYIKIDCEGFEPEVLRGAADYLAASQVLCLTSETSFHISPLLPRTHFAVINDIAIEHRLLVYDINLIRAPAPAYTDALSTIGSGVQAGRSRLALGRPGTCDVLLCRDFVGEAVNPDNFRRGEELPESPSVDQIIKAMINFELHGLMDCALELAVKFRALLADRLDVDKAIALLLEPAPEARNTADVRLAQAQQAAEMNAQRDAERDASVARIRELEAQLGAIQAGLPGAVIRLLKRYLLRYRLVYALNLLRRRILGKA